MTHSRSPVTKPRRDFYWKWPVDEQAWFAWAFQNYGSKWIVWRVGPLNYRVQVAEPGQNGGWIGRARLNGPVGQQPERGK